MFGSRINIEQLRDQSAALAALDAWRNEVEVKLSIKGKKEPERKVRLTLALAAHAAYQTARTAQREAWLWLAGAAHASTAWWLDDWRPGIPALFSAEWRVEAVYLRARVVTLRRFRLPPP